MAADWGTFITNVSDKLTSQSIQSYEEMADFLRKEYISATVGKAASPYNETHVKGNDVLLFNGFKSGFKMLYERGDLSLADKETSPEYADLDVQPPTIDTSGAADQVDLDFRDWTDANKPTIPSFVYSQFFSQYPNFPKDRNQAVLEIARKILHQFDGTSSYLQWMYSLRTGAYSDWGNLIMDQVVNLVKGEIDRPLQPGDIVGGYAKYKNASALYFIKTKDGKIDASSYSSTQSLGMNLGYIEKKSLNDAFNLIKGDVNIDGMDLTSSAIGINKKGKPLSKNDYVEGKVISTSSAGKSEIIKISYFSKFYNKTLIKELLPGTISKKLNVKEIAANLPSVELSNELLQDQHRSNPNKIPDYLTANFITTFTYSAKYDSNYLRSWLKSNNFAESTIKSIESEFSDSYQYPDEIVDLFSKDLGSSAFFTKNINYYGSQNGYNSSFNFQWIKEKRDRNKLAEYDAEEERYRNLRIRWVNEIANAARKNSDPDKPEDAYNIMAKGVLDYWKSCAQKPLTNEPGAPPCVFSSPQGGLYVPVYYGSQTMLGNNIKRSFNTGKRFRRSYEKKIAAKMVASALAYSFSMHLLELKFIYLGGIPGTYGPIPMIGFVPLVY